MIAGNSETNYYIFLFDRFGSLTQASTIKLGISSDGEDVYWPLASLLPLVSPDDIIVDGWDISSVNLADAMKRSKVLDYNLQQKLIPLMKDLKPRPSIYWPDFIAANQVSSVGFLFIFVPKTRIFLFFFFATY